MTASARNHEKSKRFLELLQAGVTALHLDPRREGVVVPERFAAQEWLILNYSYRYEISDFTCDADGVVASLSFAGRPFRCRVPWTAVFAVTNESRTQGFAWEDDLPAEVRLAQTAGDAETLAGPSRPPSDAGARVAPARALAPAPAPEAAARPRLQPLPGGAEQSAGAEVRLPPRSGHLRRVK